MAKKANNLMSARILGILVVVICLIIIPSVMASTVNLDKVSYALTETASATMTCAGNEKNQAYTVNWTNGTGHQIELDMGDTGDCTTFLENFIINSSYISTYGSGLNVTLTGTNLEGEDDATVTTAGSNILLISSITHQGTFLGLSSSIDSNVADENGKAISGGFCDINVEDPSNDHVLHTVRSTMIDGNLDFIWFLEHDRFKGNKDYVGKISCFCGSAGGIYECINEDGVNVNNSIGSSDVAFTTSQWVTFNEDPLPLSLANGTRSPTQSLFAGFDRINWIRNVTNNNPDNEAIETRVRTFLVNNDTGRIYGEQNEGSQSVTTRGFARGNSISTFDHLLAKDAPSGIYHITIVFDIIYKSLFQVAQYIKQTSSFNVTSILDSTTINNVIVRDYKDNAIDTNASTQSLSSIPNSNNTAPFTLLAEGFIADFCVNLTNNRLENTNIFLHNLVLENPTRGESFEIISEKVLQNQQIAILDSNSTEEICFRENMPVDLVTHSDYRFIYDIHVGEQDEEFDCGAECDFTGQTDFFYIGAIEDMIAFEKFITKPNATDLGNPGVYIVNENNEFIMMFDDVNYTAQEDIDWGNRTASCTAKDNDATNFTCSYNEFVTAGEKMKVCFETRSYFRDEVFIDFSNIYLDIDVGDTILTLTKPGDFIQNGLKSITDGDLYLANAPSRALEADGNLTDGYATLCTPFFDVPLDIEGGNSWDVQGDVRVSKDLYNLEEDIIFTFESDEFPIFGSRKGNDFADFITVNGLTFDQANATEGEFIEVTLNITTNHPTRAIPFLNRFLMLANRNLSAGTARPLETQNEDFPMIETEDGNFFRGGDLPPGRTFLVKSGRFRVPFGLIERDATDVIAMAFSIEFGENGDGIFPFRFDMGALDIPEVPIIAQAMEVTNITTSLGTNGQATACTPIQYSFEYSNIVSAATLTNDERYIGRTCIQDTTNDFYLSCTNIIIEPDTGVGNIGNVTVLIPYIAQAATITAEADVWVYEYDEFGTEGGCKNCGELVDFFTSPSGAYNITTNQSESCKYQGSLIQEADKTLQLLQKQAASSERSATALEGIENKTGTFHFDVDCPAQVTAGTQMSCAITGFIEDPQLVQKEVDFTCWISTVGGRVSELNFNQMITRTPATFNRNFLVLGSLAHNTQYALQCEASYYNLGSRTESFFDSFFIDSPPTAGNGVIQKEVDDLELDTEELVDDKDKKRAPINGFIFAGIIAMIFFLGCIMIVLVMRREKSDRK